MPTDLEYLTAERTRLYALLAAIPYKATDFKSDVQPRISSQSVGKSRESVLRQIADINKLITAAGGSWEVEVQAR